MGENTLNKKPKKKVEQIIQDTDEVITSITNEDMELADTNLPLKEKEKKLLDEIDTLKSSLVKARNDFDSVQGGLETEKKEIKQRLTEREKEVKSLNARLLLQQAETHVKTENTVLADRNLELMAKLKAAQTDFLQSVTHMRMKIPALKDSLRTEETEKEDSFNQIKELESHTMDTEEMCLESKGDRKEEGDEIEEGTGETKKLIRGGGKNERDERRRCERGRIREKRNSIFPLNPPTPPTSHLPPSC
ncbi:unnamed protein product [Pleuronectes platessa]|uniref:Uncharacterized protein n=1 Tax=Pleuronectes platessa TaxID=8262 RepID=A0A9N7Z7S5_PLEPL|nr:unnamed protein product [Pleuronectes platessa]